MDIRTYFGKLRYPGRTIVAGKSEDGKLLYAYAIMGRSEHSRNRIFRKEGNIVKTVAYDPSLLSDPHLIIYNAIIRNTSEEIFTNGDQSDSIADGLQEGKGFSQALESRQYEDDAPAYTPRISGMFKERCLYLSILRRTNGTCERSSWTYGDLIPGTCYTIHTYEDDGNPLPSFQGEPRKLELNHCRDAETLCHLLYESLDADNRIACYAATVGGSDYLINRKGDKNA